MNTILNPSNDIDIMGAMEDDDIGFFRALYAEDPSKILIDTYDGLSLLELASQYGSDDLIIYLVDLGCPVEPKYSDEDYVPYFSLNMLARYSRYHLLREIIRRVDLSKSEYMSMSSRWVDSIVDISTICDNWFTDDQRKVIEEGWKDS